MKTRVITVLAVAALAGAASAQLTGFKVSVGYGWSGGIRDSGGVSRTMSGPELMGSFPLSHLPLVDIAFEGDILFGGGIGNTSIKGDIYRGFITGRAQIPGSQISAWLGVGLGSAQGSSGDFASQTGIVTQLGFSMPIGMHTPGVTPSLEVAGDLASKSAISGFSVSLAVRF